MHVHAECGLRDWTRPVMRRGQRRQCRCRQRAICSTSVPWRWRSTQVLTWLSGLPVSCCVLVSENSTGWEKQIVCHCWLNCTCAVKRADISIKCRCSLKPQFHYQSDNLLFLTCGGHTSTNRLTKVRRPLNHLCVCVTQVYSKHTASTRQRIIACCQLHSTSVANAASQQFTVKSSSCC